MSELRERMHQEAAERIASSISEPQIAIALMMEQGASREQALEALALDPHTTERLSDQIEAHRTRIAEEAEADLDAEFAASPEGRRIEAARVHRERQERAQLVEQARTMIQVESGLDVEGFSDEEILHHAGIEPRIEMMSVAQRDAAANELVANWHSLDPAERRQQQRALGISDRAIKSHTEPHNAEGSNE